MRRRRESCDGDAMRAAAVAASGRLACTGLGGGAPSWRLGPGPSRAGGAARRGGNGLGGGDSPPRFGPCSASGWCHGGRSGGRGRPPTPPLTPPTDFIPKGRARATRGVGAVVSRGGGAAALVGPPACIFGDRLPAAGRRHQRRRRWPLPASRRGEGGERATQGRDCGQPPGRQHGEWGREGGNGGEGGGMGGGQEQGRKGPHGGGAGGQRPQGAGRAAGWGPCGRWEEGIGGAEGQNRYCRVHAPARGQKGIHPPCRGLWRWKGEWWAGGRVGRRASGRHGATNSVRRQRGGNAVEGVRGRWQGVGETGAAGTLRGGCGGGAVKTFSVGEGGREEQRVAGVTGYPPCRPPPHNNLPAWRP